MTDTRASCWKPTGHAFGERLSSELAFVLSCASPLFDSATRTHIEEWLSRELDWNVVSQLGQRHGLSPLLYSRLNELLPDPLPPSFSQLKNNAVTLTQAALILTTQMKHLVPLLAANGIETVVFKGPPLARTLYGSLVLRPFTDLDLMVRPEQVPRAWELLESENYTLSYRLTKAQLPALIASGNHLPFYGEPNGELVELHWTFFAKSRATTFDTHGAWSRRQPFPFDDVTIPTLAPFDLIHFLCLHGAKHAWCRLNWLADVAWFLFRYPTFDWNPLLDTATRAGTRRMMLAGLLLVQELFGAPLDEQIIQAIEADAQVESLARWMWQRVLNGTQTIPTGHELVYQTWHSRERPRDRIRDFYYQLMELRPNNLEDNSLSAKLFHTYTLHRLRYLLFKYSGLHNPPESSST